MSICYLWFQSCTESWDHREERSSIEFLGWQHPVNMNSYLYPMILLSRLANYCEVWCDVMILQQLQSALPILSGLELCQLSLINNSSSHVMHTLYHGRGSRVLYNTVKCTQKTSLFLCTVNPRQSDPVQKKCSFTRLCLISFLLAVQKRKKKSGH